MSSFSFYEFAIQKKKSDIFSFLDNYNGTINEFILPELYAKFGNDDVVNEALSDWWNKAKEMAAGAVKGAKEFGQGFVQGSQQGYKDTRTEEGVKKIENIAAKVGELSKAFTQKYKIDPVTAAIIISSGATGGLGAIPMTVLAIGLRKGSAWLAGKGMDAAWKKATGKTPAELDQMWQAKINDPKAAAGAPAAAGAQQPPTLPPAAGAGAPAAAGAQQPPPLPPAAAGAQQPPPLPPAAGAPAKPVRKKLAATGASAYGDQFNFETFNRSKTSFANFLENKDFDLYKNIIDEGIWDDAKGLITGTLNKGADIAKGYAKDIGDQGFARATGSLVGKGAGQAAGTFVNLGSVLGSSLKNAASFMANNPVKTGTMMMAIAAGSMIGSYGTQAINSFIHKPSADQVQELTAAAKQAGVPDSEIAQLDSSYSGSGGDFDSTGGAGGDFDSTYSGSGGDFDSTGAGKSKIIQSKDPNEFVPKPGTQTYYANQDTNYKTMPTPGSPEDTSASWNSDLGDYKEKIGPSGEKLFQSEDGNFYKVTPSKVNADTSFYQKVDPTTGNAIGKPSITTDYMRTR